MPDEQQVGVAGEAQGSVLRGPTYGEQAVGFTFNPGNDPTVQKVKELYAQIIDLCAEGRRACTEEQKPPNSERARLYSVAITEAQTAQMWAVKAITWK